jgi:hypothetical protein
MDCRLSNHEARPGRNKNYKKNMTRSPKMVDHDKPERFGRDESLFIETSRTLRRPN